MQWERYVDWYAPVRVAWERLDEAEEMLGRALAKNPASPAYLDSLGWVYFRKGDLARAVATLERAVGAEEDATIL